MALRSRCTYPSIHFFVSRSRSVVWQAHIQAFTLKLSQDHGRLSGVWGVVWCCVRVRVCGVWWSSAHTLSLVLSPSSSLSLSFSLLSLFFSLLFLFLFLFLFLLLLLLLLLLRLLNVIWCKVHSNRFPPSSSPLPPPFSPSPPQKKRGTFLLQEYFRRFFFLLQF